MALTFGEQSKKLVGMIHNLTTDEARRRINKSFRDNCNAHGWRHLLKRFTIQTEAQYNTGTLTATNASTSVAGASTVWVTSWVTAPSQRRIVISGRNEPYDVSAIGSATALTLADSFIGDTDSDLTYTMFRDTYPLPTDCGVERLVVIYDMDLRFRLINFNQPKFLAVRSVNPTLVSIPECFSIIGQTAETTPRPQIQMYPAASTVRAYHGWYFRRPSLLSSDGSYFDWPEEYDDMIWMKALMDFYREPHHYSPKYLAEWKPSYADIFSRMKTNLDGMGAIDYEIEQMQTGERSQGWNPNVLGLSGETMVSWE